MEDGVTLFYYVYVHASWLSNTIGCAIEPDEPAEPCEVSSGVDRARRSEQLFGIPVSALSLSNY